MFTGGRLSKVCRLIFLNKVFLDEQKLTQSFEPMESAFIFVAHSASCGNR
jgi:hypothetical protein